MLFVGGVVAFFAILVIGLTIVQFRRVTPNAYRCLQCQAEFSKPAHQDYPDRCPTCGARKWAT